MLWMLILFLEVYVKDRFGLDCCRNDMEKRSTLTSKLNFNVSHKINPLLCNPLRICG